jgi:membrane protease YdiL (CAAX protease family)
VSQHSALKKPAHYPQQRKRLAEPRPWDWLAVVIVFAALMISRELIALVLGGRLAARMPEIGRVGVRVTLLVVFYLFELVVLAYLAHRRELPFLQAYRLKADTAAVTDDSKQSARGVWPAWVTAVAVGGFLLLLRGIATGYNALTSVYKWQAPSSASMTTLFGHTVFGLLGAVLTVVLLAPFIEELVFRVIMQESFARKFPRFVAIGMQALIFSVCHLSLWAAIPNVLLALAAGILAARARTIWPAVILHVLYNGIIVAAAFFLAFQ